MSSAPLQVHPLQFLVERLTNLERYLSGTLMKLNDRRLSSILFTASLALALSTGLDAQSGYFGQNKVQDPDLRLPGAEN